jgi:putative oxidoreductase
MNAVVTKFAPVVGRFLIALIFLLSGIGKIGAFAGTAASMAKMGIPLAEVALVVTIIIEIGGAAMLILGWQAWLGATALFLWMIPVTFLYHNFWAVPPEQYQLQQIMFMKNLAIMGGLLYVMSFGSGGYSLDRK